MGVRFYDEAIYKKISKWVNDPSIRILKPDETQRLFEIKYDNENGDQQLTLPMIALSREKNIEILNTNKHSKTFDGFKTNSNEKSSVQINVVPIEINYQIDIYTKGMAEADEYVRNFVFNIINYPKVKVTLPYNNLNIVHESNIRLDPSIADNSDIKEHMFPDQFVRFTLKFNIDDAYLFSLPARENKQIIPGLNVIDRTSGEIVESSEF